MDVFGCYTGDIFVQINPVYTRYSNLGRALVAYYWHLTYVLSRYFAFASSTTTLAIQGI